MHACSVALRERNFYHQSYCSNRLRALTVDIISISIGRAIDMATAAAAAEDEAMLSLKKHLVSEGKVDVKLFEYMVTLE